MAVTRVAWLTSPGRDGPTGSAIGACVSPKCLVDAGSGYCGPLARNCRDAGALLAVLSDTPCAVKAARADRLRVALINQHVDAESTQPDVRRAFDEACHALEKAGATLVHFDMPELALAVDALMMILLPEASVVHAERYERHAAAYGRQTRIQIEQGFLVPAMSYVRAQQLRRRLAGLLLEILDRVDAIVSPTVPWVAPSADPAIGHDEGFDEMFFVAPYNLAGLPTLSVPCGLGLDNLPVGLQIAGAPHRDKAVLGIGATVEALLPLPKSAPSMD